MSERAPRETFVGNLARRMIRTPHAIRSIVIIVVLALMAWGAWAWQLREEPVMVFGQCATCGGTVQIEWDALRWPAPCPRCRTEAVSYLVVCPKGHVFTRSSPFSHERCPECGADLGRPFTEADRPRLSRRGVRRARL